MPLSSGSGASVGSSGAATILAPSARRFFSVSVSLSPKSAGGSDRNMRPNWPPKNLEPRDSVSPRIVVPCALRAGPAMISSNFTEVVQFDHNILDCVDRRTDSHQLVVELLNRQAGTLRCGRVARCCAGSWQRRQTGQLPRHSREPDLIWLPGMG